MDFLRQSAGNAGSQFLRQTSGGKSGSDFSRVPEWLKTVGETVGYVGQTAATLAPAVATAAKVLL